MRRAISTKIVSIFATLALAFAFPAAAFAAQTDVQVENHTAAGAQTVSGLFIDAVDASETGKALDEKAIVSTAEGVTWDIPVLWIDDDLQLATEATEGHTYLPALAFFVPQDYAVEGDSFTVTLSDSLSKLFGDGNAIAVFDARTGITYIMPVSLKDFIVPEATVAEQEEPDFVDGFGDGGNYPALTNVEIWCAKTARDVLTDADLEWLIDLVLHTLEPQAVNLLIDSFPSFKSAAASGQIGTHIGLYVYYRAGDKDGMPEHESAAKALAYVNGDSAMIDGELKYCYMIGIDVADMLLKKDGELVRNANTGKFMLDRDGAGSVTFNNTIVHELFHAFMDDYNRTGMLGAKSVADGYTPGGNFVSDAQRNLFSVVYYPKWFIEGTASAVENVYQFRYDMFEMLRAKRDSSTVFEDTYTGGTLLYNYLNAKIEGGSYLYFDLENASNDNVDTTQSRYVSGYLATLYLAQLAAQKDPSIGSAVDGQKNFSSEKLRLGLDSILKRMHNGETLDQVIKDISTINGAAPLYADTDDFTKKFIKGVPDSTSTYYEDTASMAFTLDFLNYMRGLEKTPGRNNKPNGSILFGFDQDFNIPLDESKQYESNCFIIITTNGYVESSVPDSVAFASGGKSDPPNSSTAAAQTAAAKADAELPLAAKADAEPCPAEEIDEPEAVAAEEAAAAATGAEPVTEQAAAPASADHAPDNADNASDSTASNPSSETPASADEPPALTVTN